MVHLSEDLHVAVNRKSLRILGRLGTYSERLRLASLLIPTCDFMGPV